jgi:asparagine synthase (glutamine-hydrolysing)
VEQVPRIAAAYDEPFGNSSALPTFCCARFAKSHGVDHLLAGDGGDELFGGNDRYVRQKVFEHYGRLPSWLRNALVQPLAERFDPDTSPLLLRKFSSYVRQARVPLPERYESWNMIYREGAAEVFDADLIATVDTAHHLRKMQATWDECPSDDLLDRMLWYDWKFTLADNDLRKVVRMCELADVRVSFPMLDEAVVDLSLQVPSSAKINGNELRSFFKSSVRDFLPREIIDKKKHGFGLPFGVWLKTHRPLQELVYDSLNDLKGRHLLNRKFIERVAEEHREGHASYYGYAIWDLMMLEQWLAQRGRQRTEQTAHTVGRAEASP